MKIANRDARSYVGNREVFTGSNTFSKYVENTTRYVVYSYGLHWPLFIHDRGTWYENIEKTSPTTSKHTTQCRPIGENFIPMDRESMLRIACEGIAGLAACGPLSNSRARKQSYTGEV